MASRADAAGADCLDRRACLFCICAGADGISCLAQYRTRSQRGGTQLDRAALDGNRIWHRVSALLTSLQLFETLTGQSALARSCLDCADAGAHLHFAVRYHSANAWVAVRA